MRKTVLGLVIGGALLVSVARLVSSGPDAGTAADPPDPAADALADAHAESAALYARICSACHGRPGDRAHTLGTRLLEPAYGATREDSTIARFIAEGVPGTTMMGFGEEKAGLLSAAQVDAMVRWIRATGGRAQ